MENTPLITREELELENSEGLWDLLAKRQCLSLRLCQYIYGELTDEELIAEILEGEAEEGEAA